METAFALTLKVFGETDDKRVHHCSGIFPGVDAAVKHFLDRAEEIAIRDERRTGDYFCEVVHGSSKSKVAKFRIQKLDGLSIRHSPQCKCISCYNLMRMSESA